MHPGARSSFNCPTLLSAYSPAHSAERTEQKHPGSCCLLPSLVSIYPAHHSCFPRSFHHTARILFVTFTERKREREREMCVEVENLAWKECSLSNSREIVRSFLFGLDFGKMDVFVCRHGESTANVQKIIVSGDKGTVCDHEKDKRREESMCVPKHRHTQTDTQTHTHTTRCGRVWADGKRKGAGQGCCRCVKGED